MNHSSDSRRCFAAIAAQENSAARYIPSVPRAMRAHPLALTQESRVAHPLRFVRAEARSKGWEFEFFGSWHRPACLLWRRKEQKEGPQAGSLLFVP